VRAVHVLKKLSDVSGPDLIEAGCYNQAEVLANSLMAAPLVHFILVGLNSKIYIFGGCKKLIGICTFV
jgi:hypothetical protein